MNYDFQTHLDKGEHEKRVWYWPFKWYTQPYALTSDEWKKSDTYFKKNYPVQFFIRETLGLFVHRYFVYRYKEIKWNVKGYVRNPRKEMRDKLFPIRWSDLTETIVQFHLEAIIEFVDREMCFEITDYSHDKAHQEFAAQLRECYHYAKFTRPALLQRQEKAYENIPVNVPYKEAYKEVTTIENDIEEFDTKVCEWVIKNRKMFWC